MTDETRLRTAPLVVLGRFHDASNATLLVWLDDDPGSPRPAGRSLDELDPAHLAVYKPARGEAPLWDFPEGTLHRREVAAYVVAAAIGWDLVPATIVREDAPFGPGSLQRFVAHDPSRHYFVLRDEADPAVVVQLRQMVLFDLVIDNADRKSGHVLVEEGTDPPQVRLVDHGVSFNAHDKHRTVAWDFAHEPVEPGERAPLEALRRVADERLVPALAGLLSTSEVEVLLARLEAVAALATFPAPNSDRPYPWPLV